MTARLTDPQRRMLVRLQTAEIPPTIRELGVYMGGYGTNAVNDVLRALARKGYLEHVPGSRSRASWRVVRPLPGVVSPVVALQLIRDALDAGGPDVLDRVRAIAFGDRGTAHEVAC